MSRSFASASSQGLFYSGAVLTSLPITMACWMKTSDVNTAAILMALVDGTASTSGLDILLYNADFYAQSHFTDNRYAQTAGNMSPNVWIHSCAVFASTTSRTVYRDGGNSGTNAQTSTPTGLDTTSIGYQKYSTPTNYFNGQMAEAAIWSAALSASEVLVLAKGYSPLFVRPQSLSAYWPLIRDGDRDRRGGFNMTPVNSPTVAAHPRIIYPAQPFYTVPVAAAPAQTEGPLTRGRLIRGGSLSGVLVR